MSKKDFQLYFEKWSMVWGTLAAVVLLGLIAFYGYKEGAHQYESYQRGAEQRAAAAFAQQQKDCNEAAKVSGLMSRFEEGSCEVFVEETGNRGGFWMQLAFYENYKASQ